MRSIYLDNSATTALSAGVREAMLGAMEAYGNPSSLHKRGLEAKGLLEEARASVREALGVARVREAALIFTASGTEANNLAILGTAYAKARRQANVILTTDSEHPSVAAAMEKLASDGFRIVTIPTRGGVLDEQALERALENAASVLMMSFMLVNNETGALYRVGEAFAAAKRKNPAIVTHCDAVQGFLKCPFTPMTLSADLVTVSAHKIHGPKGVGALYVSPEMIKTKRITPTLYGGGQEGGWRSGTENLLGIVGFGKACREGVATLAGDIEAMATLRAYAIGRLGAMNVTPNLPAGEAAPHVLSITLPGIKSQTMLNFLSEKGIYVSSGSACSARSRRVSPTLVAFGLGEAEADATLRLSFSSENTREDIDALCEALQEGIDTLIPFRRGKR